VRVRSYAVLRTIVLLQITIGLFPVVVRAQADTAHDVSDTCGALASADFSGVSDAPAQVTNSALVRATSNVPAFCQVQGYVAPQVGFELRLPVSHWNGKFIELGCGGWCGTIYGEECNASLRKGYACIVTDGGHKGRGDDGLWAQNNLQAQIDFGYRAIHVTALAGKAIVERYYKATPRYSYFNGCSTGGYQALVEAQRFPWDFNGIIAGAPDLDHADTQMRVIWHLRSFFAPDGTPLLKRKDLELVHQAALAKCDLDDGLHDGIIGNPVGCKFDPSVLLCAHGQSVGCLSKAQVDAVTKIYFGPVNSKGEPISTRGFFPGSELGWSDWTPEGLHSAEEFFRYALFTPSPGSHWTAQDFDFDRDYKRLGIGAFYTDTNPDLRKFKATGGKLIAYQGGSDPIEIPGALYDYYETTERTMGGGAATQSFFRLFIMPGMNHCMGGDGVNEADFLGAVEAWVEMNRAPDVIIGSHIDLDQFMKTHDWRSESFLTEFENFRGDPANVRFTRPLYPYPAYAKYKGTGDPKKAGNFRPAITQ
jgi:Tannase and feruloyl esterase